MFFDNLKDLVELGNFLNYENYKLEDIKKMILIDNKNGQHFNAIDFFKT